MTHPFPEQVDLTEPEEGGVEDTHSPDDKGVETCVDDTLEVTE